MFLAASKAPADASQFIPCCEIVPDASRTWQYVAPLSAGMVLVGQLAKPEGWARPLVGAVNGGFALAHAGFAWNALNEREESSVEAESYAAVNVVLTFASAVTAWSLLRSRPDEPAASGSETGVARALRSQRPRLLAPSAAWVGGRLGLQLRLVH